MNPITLLKYLRDPERCPYCDSSNLTMNLMDIGIHKCSRPIQCLDCNKKWKDIYELNQVEEIS